MTERTVMNRLFTARELATILKVSPKTIYRLGKTGDLVLRSEKLMAQNKELTGLLVGQMIGIVE